VPPRTDFAAIFAIPILAAASLHNVSWRSPVDSTAFEDSPMLRSSSLVIFLWLSIGTTFAQVPRKMPPAEGIPAPRPIDTPDIIIGGPLPRPDTREVWQYYGVNRFGRFVPRVVVTPGGDYFYRNGEPYPWVQNYPGRVMPAAGD
jgi:hypothetical protein